MAKYIRCDCCGKRIDFGEEVFKFPGYCGLYCSSDCFTDSYADIGELDDELAYGCHHEIYDDEERKRELEEKIKEYSKELKIMQHRQIIGKRKIYQRMTFNCGEQNSILKDIEDIL